MAIQPTDLPTDAVSLGHVGYNPFTRETSRPVPMRIRPPRRTVRVHGPYGVPRGEPFPYGRASVDTGVNRSAERTATAILRDGGFEFPSRDGRGIRPQRRRRSSGPDPLGALNRYLTIAERAQGRR